MKVTDYIIDFLVSKGVTDMFGYPGGVICHLIDSATKYKGEIEAHCMYHEQAAAFAACGFAQESNNIGVAYATSGPGATNLVTGIANAFFDSIPTIFFTGQVDTYGLKGNLPIRQRGFQETDVVSIVEKITKYAVRVDDPKMIGYYLEKAYDIALGGNPGPVVLDLPADVQRADVDVDELKQYDRNLQLLTNVKDEVFAVLHKELKRATKPCLLVGNGVKQSGQKDVLRRLAEKLNIPVVFSMPAFDTLSFNHPLNFGFIGANGHRYANFILGKSDLIISLGSRLDVKQVGNIREKFAPKAKLIRIDIDKDSFEHFVHKDEIDLFHDLKELLPQWLSIAETFKKGNDSWIETCKTLKKQLYGYDNTDYTLLLQRVGNEIPQGVTITADVGQSAVWLAQVLQVKERQSVHISAGHGAMGYSLPAAIGAYYANRRPVWCFNGDGGVQMNLQELQYISREKLPIKIVIINNYALGMIRGFQEANFEKNYTQTTMATGYSAPSFSKIAYAYDLPYLRISKEEDVKKIKSLKKGTALIEIVMPIETHLVPNFGEGGLIQDQRPYLDREVYNSLMEM